MAHMLLRRPPRLWAIYELFKGAARSELPANSDKPRNTNPPRPEPGNRNGMRGTASDYNQQISMAKEDRR